MSIIECRDVNVTLGQNHVLHDVSMALNTGEAVALLGGNGSGKTTLLRTILGLIPHSTGEVNVLGSPVEKLRDWRGIGYVPQRSELNVTNATVREVVESGRLAHRKLFRPLTADDNRAVNLALEEVHLTERAKTAVSILSGGQRQRTMIARALAGEPRAILLDEPLAGLDVKTQDGLAAVLGELKAAGLAMLVVLHELGPMEPLIDRSIVLREGRVIHDGPLRDGPGTHDGHHREDDVFSILRPLDTFVPPRADA